jgi:hypothetical protein
MYGMSHNLQYAKANVVNDDIMCKNYEICRTMMSSLRHMHGNYLCRHCIFGMGLGELEFIGVAKCRACPKVMKRVYQPNCDHLLCLDCFRVTYYKNISDPETQTADETLQEFIQQEHEGPGKCPICRK